MLEVAPERLHVLDPHAEPQQPGRDAVALVAVPRLDRRRARRRGSSRCRSAASTTRPGAPHRRPRRRTTAARRSRRASSVLRAGRRGLGSGQPPLAGAPASRRASSSAVADWRRTRSSSVSRERSSSHAGSAAAPLPVFVRTVSSRSYSSSERVTSTPSRRSACPPRYFVALCRTRSTPCSSGRSSTGDDAVASTRTGAGWAAAASRSGNDSIGFAGASSQTRSAPSGGFPVWSNATNRSPQGSSSPSRPTVPK